MLPLEAEKIKHMKEKLLIIALVIANLISIFFNFRWTFFYPGSDLWYVFVTSYWSLILSTFLSIIALYLLLRPKFIDELDSLDSIFIHRKKSKRLIILSLAFTIVGCTLPETIDFLEEILSSTRR